MKWRVGVIGGGIAGLTLALRLKRAGHSVVILDKGRGVGGRTSTRRGPLASFDHGAQYFTVRDPEFDAFLNDQVSASNRAVWSGRFASLEAGGLVPEPREEPRWVGVPGMSAIAQSLAVGLEVRTEVKVVELTGSPGDWSLAEAGGSVLGPFDWVVCTAPPAQSAALLSGWSPIAEEANQVLMRPCFSLMIVPKSNSTLPADGIRCDHPVLGWAAIDGGKPGRSGSNNLVIQSSNEWAEAHVDDDLESVARALKDATTEAFDLDLSEVAFEAVHRWLYAKPVEPLGRPFLADPDARLALAGDWCLAGKVEGAYRSGIACSEILEREA